MKKFFALLLSVVLMSCYACGSSNDNNEEPQPQPNPEVVIEENDILMAEQGNTGVMILDGKTHKIKWQWRAGKEGGFKDVDFQHFDNPSEVKPVYNNKYVLMTASGGAVALIRIADKKVVFHAYADENFNAHSAEILPDGNIVTAASYFGRVCVFHADEQTPAAELKQNYSVKKAHNVVWDKERERLYLTDDKSVMSCAYNNNKTQPELIDWRVEAEFPSTEHEGHDLFPVYGSKDELWLTTNEGVWKWNIATKEFTKFSTFKNVKSISDNKEGQVMMLKPTISWYSDGAIDEQGNRIFRIAGFEIYKVRWMTDNTFSYPKEHIAPYTK